MGTIVDATVPPAEFALADTFEAVPDADFETVRVVAAEDGHVMPYLWGRASDSGELERALEADSSTREVTRLGPDGDRVLYRIDWRAHATVVVDVLLRERGTLLRARAQDGRWTFRVLFPDRDAVSATYQCFKERGIEFDVRRVVGLSDPVGDGGTPLTDEQQEALAAAFETNYYGVPRELTQEELADELGVSHQALSERLRRGHRILVERSLGTASASAVDRQ